VGTTTNIWTRRYDNDGTPVTGPTQVTTSGKADHADIACDASDCAVAWQDTRTGTSFIYLKIGTQNEVRVSLRSAWAAAASLEAYPVGFAVAWDAGDIYTAAYEYRSGGVGWTRVLSTDTRVSTSGVAWQPALVWSGSEFGVTWRDNRDGNNEAYATVLASDGSRMVPERNVSSDANYTSYADIATSGSEGYNVAFHDNRSGNMEIYVVRLDRWANPQGPPIRLTNDAAFSLYPSIAWDGEGVDVVFRDDRNSTFTHYFASLTCECPDEDGDGVCGYVDNCPMQPGTNLWDRDRDGAGDECDGDDDGDGFQDATDRCPACPSTTDPDGDADGFGNACDNCPTVFNPIAYDRPQTDTDTDGVGNACDPDDDGDGYGDTVDNCPLYSNGEGPLGSPAQVDSDGDSAGNPCDMCTDVDGDGACNECAIWLSGCDLDCQPMDPTTARAPEFVTGVRVESLDDIVLLSWDSLAPRAGSSVVYDVVTGNLMHLQQFGSFADASCIREDWPYTSHDLFQQAAPGNGFWYLVRGENVCGVGSYDDGTGTNPDYGIWVSPGRCFP
jgi:hypothetical protein